MKKIYKTSKRIKKNKVIYQLILNSMPSYTAYENELDYDIACELEKSNSQEEYEEMCNYFCELKKIYNLKLTINNYGNN